MTVVLVTGGSGQLGRALRCHAWPEGVTIVAPWRGELELADADAVSGFMQATRAEAVINAAAFTAVDQAESRPAAAFHGNALVPAAIAEAAAGAGAPLVHVSTDYVFDGASNHPYETDHLVQPLNVYGASKAAGELAVRAIQPRSAIVRTSWLVSPDGSNFLKTMLRLALTRDRIGVVDDQRGRPTIAADLAAALATVALRLVRDAEAPTGVFHFANEGATTWWGFAAAIFEAASERGIKVPAVDAIATSAYPTPARRPANSELSTRRIERDYGIVPPSWRAALPGLIEAALETAT